MGNTILVILGVIALMVVIELFALPDWIGRKLRNDIPGKQTLDRLAALESRVSELEKKIH